LFRNSKRRKCRMGWNISKWATS